MIPTADFQRLRLSDFVAEVEPLSNWRFLGRDWVGEADGFTEWLRPVKTPDRLESVSLDLAELPAAVSAEILRCLDLPLQPGMRLPAIIQALDEPVGCERFVEDRLSYSFELDDYWVSCTLHHRDGLIYVVVLLKASRAWPPRRPRYFLEWLQAATVISAILGLLLLPLMPILVCAVLMLAWGLGLSF